jgi:hypothetical protein
LLIWKPANWNKISSSANPIIQHTYSTRCHQAGQAPYHLGVGYLKI